MPGQAPQAYHQDQAIGGALGDAMNAKYGASTGGGVDLPLFNKQGPAVAGTGVGYS